MDTCAIPCIYTQAMIDEAWERKGADKVHTQTKPFNSRLVRKQGEIQSVFNWTHKTKRLSVHTWDNEQSSCFEH